MFLINVIKKLEIFLKFCQNDICSRNSIFQFSCFFSFFTNEIILNLLTLKIAVCFAFDKHLWAGYLINNDGDLFTYVLRILQTYKFVTVGFRVAMAICRCHNLEIGPTSAQTRTWTDIPNRLCHPSSCRHARSSTTSIKQSW